MQRFHVVLENLPRPAEGFIENPLDLGVHHFRGLLGDFVALPDFASQENLMLAVADRDRAHGIAHAELGHHPARHLGRLLDILRGSGGDLLRAEDQLLGHPATVRHRQTPENVFLGVVVAIFFRQREGDAERPAAGNDGHLVHRVEELESQAHQRVPGLVVRRELPLLIRQDEASPLDAQHDLVLGVLEVDHFHPRLDPARRQQGGLIHHVGEIRPGESGCRPRNHLEPHLVTQRNLGPASMTGKPLKRIVVVGLSDQIRNDLLSRLPVHEGDILAADSYERVSRAVREFDEHMNIALSSRDGDVTFVITAVGGVMAPAPASAALASGADTPRRITIGGNVQQAKLISQTRPQYPALAKQARISGVVQLQAVIASDGTVKDLKVLSGHPLLVPAALDSVKLWVYQQTLLNGEPVEVMTQIDVNFTLSE